jgi:predicted nucleic-acid-binding protein
METFDTNVIVRLLVEDDPAQSELALRRWQQAVRGTGVFLLKLVLAEAAWVLSRSYDFPRASIVDVLTALLNTAGLTVEDEPEVRAALGAYADGGGADLSDHLILECARAAGALPVQTFDRRFARIAGASILAGALP